MWLVIGITFLVISVILCSIGIAVLIANGATHGVPQPNIYKPLILIPGDTYVGSERVLIPYNKRPLHLTEDGYTYTIDYDGSYPLETIYYAYESTLFPAVDVQRSAYSSRGLVWYQFINNKITFYFPTSLENSTRSMVSIEYTLQGNIISLPIPGD